jgi:hypothetical protein
MPTTITGEAYSFAELTELVKNDEITEAAWWRAKRTLGEISLDSDWADYCNDFFSGVASACGFVGAKVDEWSVDSYTFRMSFAEVDVEALLSTLTGEACSSAEGESLEELRAFGLYNSREHGNCYVGLSRPYRWLRTLFDYYVSPYLEPLPQFGTGGITSVFFQYLMDPKEQAWKPSTGGSIRRRLYEFERELSALKRGLEAWGLSMLQQEYEYLCPDEELNELAEANGYLFFKNGSLIPHELYPKK